MLSKCKFGLLSSLFLLFASSVCADEIVSLKAGYQMLSPTGSVAGLTNGIGQRLDVVRDLNLDDSENATLEANLQWGNARFSFNYLPVDFSGTGILTLDGSFNGQPFTTNDTVKSDLTIDFYDFGFTYYLINLDDIPTRFQFGLELAVKLADAEVIFNDLTQGFIETATVTAPIPTVGARARIALADFIGVTGRFGYMEYDGNSFLDAEAQIEVSPIPLVGVYVGYRHFDLVVDDSDVFIKTDFTGPFGGILVRF